MVNKIVTLLSLAASVSAWPLSSRATCAPAHVLWARGTNETYTNSTLLPLVAYLKTKLSSSDAPIIYPATAIPTQSTPAYRDSVQAGINNTVQQIQAKVSACGSKSNIILLGYSQGGQVMTDTLVGGSYQSGNIDPSYWKYIFGDTTFVANSSYAAGNATTNGIFQRFQNDPTEASLNKNFANTLRSYCTAGDPICSGLENQNIGAHLAEVRDHASDAEAFILHLFGK